MMTAPRNMLRFARLLPLLSLLTLVGCVQRTISITSEPTGALVYLNDEEVGRTPVTVPYRFYGVYDVRLELDGHQPLWTEQKADAPWWEAPGPDLFAELFTDAKVEQKWHYQLAVAPLMQEDELRQRAQQLRAELQGQPAPNSAATAASAE